MRPTSAPAPRASLCWGQHSSHNPCRPDSTMRTSPTNDTTHHLPLAYEIPTKNLRPCTEAQRTGALEASHWILRISDCLFRPPGVVLLCNPIYICRLPHCPPVRGCDSEWRFGCPRIHTDTGDLDFDLINLFCGEAYLLNKTPSDILPSPRRSGIPPQACL